MVIIKQQLVLILTSNDISWRKKKKHVIFLTRGLMVNKGKLAFSDKHDITAKVCFCILLASALIFMFIF